jgi:hypothetical protein
MAAGVFRRNLSAAFAALMLCAATPALAQAPDEASSTVDTPEPQVLLAAGNIADANAAGACVTGSGTAATAALLDGIAGTVQTLGDNASPGFRPSSFNNCYNRNWGRHKARTHPAAGDDEYDRFGPPNDVQASPYIGYFGSEAGAPARFFYSYDLPLTNGDSWHVVVLNS